MSDRINGKVHTGAADGRRASSLKLRHIILCLVISTLGSFLVWYLQALHTPSFCTRQILEDPISLLTDAEVLATGYDITGDTYVMQDGEADPQLVFSGITVPYRAVEVLFAEPLSGGDVFQIFWPDDSGQYAAERSLLILPREGETDYIVDLPDEASGSLRIDINGNFRLMNVLVSDSPSGMTAKEADDTDTASDSSVPLLVFLLVVNTIIAFLVLRLIVVLKASHTKEDAAPVSRIEEGASGRGEGVSSLSSSAPHSAYRPARRDIAPALAALFLFPACGALFLTLGGRQIYLQEWAFLIAGGVCSSLFLLLRRRMGDHPELGFAVSALFAGLLLFLLTPESTYVSWDDEIHYQHALSLSFGGVVRETAADISLIRRLYKPVYTSASAVPLHNALLDTLYREGVVRIVISPDTFSPSNVSYIPAALGLVAGRALHLSFCGIFLMGRLFNLLFYILMGVLSIRALKYGKMLAALILLLPINLFQACSYTTDTWCFVFILYGVCRYAGFLQDKERRFSIPRALFTGLIVIIGSLTKPVYLPVLILLFVIPKEKFTERRQRVTWYSIIILCTAIFVPIAVRIWPALLSGLTDSRGGEDVDAMGQAAGIAAHPGTYLSMALGYIFREYLSPMQESSYLTVTGYFPIDPDIAFYVADFPGTTFWLILLVFTAIAGGSKEEEQSVSGKVFAGGKAALFIGGILSVFLTVTAMYLFYTPVGYGTVLGCQGRYVEPVILNLFWLLRSRKVQHHFNESHFNQVLLACAFVLFLAGSGIVAFMVTTP